MGPFYSQLGHGKQIHDLKAHIGARFNMDIEHVRVELIYYRPKEQLNANGCPSVQSVITPGRENILVTAKKRPHHKCEYTFIISQIIVYNAIPEAFGTNFREQASKIIGKYAIHKPRGKTER